MDRLTIEQVEEWIGGMNHDGMVRDMAKQLADTMRENERLNNIIHQYRIMFDPMQQSNIEDAAEMEKFKLPDDHKLQWVKVTSNKDSV